ncbi:MAG: hypothetical protein O3C63_01495 [Cyanobacteria bacterium]|nr:hypothetical protein [Cyanobacteriota bacterium]
MNKILPALTLAAASLLPSGGQDLEAAEPAAKPNSIYSETEQTTPVVPYQRPAAESRKQVKRLAHKITSDSTQQKKHWIFQPSYAPPGANGIPGLQNLEPDGYPKSRSRVEPATRGNWILAPNGRVYRPGETIYPRSYNKRNYWHSRSLPGSDPRFDPSINRRYSFWN